MSSEPQRKTINIDGQRPVDESEITVKGTLDIDGQRPIAAAENET